MLSYNYKYLIKVAEFPDFEVWKTDSLNVPTEDVITEDELNTLIEEQQKQVSIWTIN